MRIRSIQYTNQEKQAALVCVIATFLVMLVVMSTIAIIDIAAELREEAEDIVTRVELIGADGQKEQQRLLKTTAPACSSAHLEAMRASLHRHFFIQSIKYQDSSVQCQVGEHPDYDKQLPLADGLEIKGAFNVLDDNDQTIIGLEAQIGNYTFIYPNQLPNSFILFAADYEMSFQRKDETNYYHWMGNERLHQRLESGWSTWLPEFALIVEQCGTKYHFCTSLGYSPAQFAQAISEWVLVIIGLSFVASLILFIRIHRHFVNRRTLKHRVKEGLANNLFYCEYQPIVELKTGNIVGCEALARFRDQYGQLSPIEFIPQIAALNQTEAFTRHILMTAINEIAPIASVRDGLKLNVNVFPEQLTSDSLWRFIYEQAAHAAELNLVIEVTEDQQLDLNKSVPVTQTARQKGVQLAIDDFGTGYSNLATLEQLNCDILKIDRSFVNGLQFDSVLSSLVPNIVEIANKLNMVTVAEGIETAVQHQALLKLNVQQGQGWLFGKPASANAFSQRLAK